MQVLLLCTGNIRIYIWSMAKKNFRVKKTDLEETDGSIQPGRIPSAVIISYTNGPEMLSTNRPNHAGTQAAKVLGQKGRELQITVLKDLSKGDVLEFPDGHGELYTWQRLEKRRKAYDICFTKNQLWEKKGAWIVSNQMQCIACNVMNQTYVNSKTSGEDLRTCCSETW